MSERSQISGRQIAAARVLLGMDQVDLAKRARISVATLRRMEASGGAVSGYANNVYSVRRTLMDEGIEFSNGDQAGVRMKSFKLKDRGKDAYFLDHMSKFFEFSAMHAEREISVRVQDLALESLALDLLDKSISRGTDYLSALGMLRRRIFVVAAEKYERGLIEAGDIVSVMYDDVAQH
jgi:transcriptional regulator with XRE-family HTH domain